MRKIVLLLVLLLPLTSCIDDIIDQINGNKYNNAFIKEVNIPNFSNSFTYNTLSSDIKVRINGNIVEAATINPLQVKFSGAINIHKQLIMNNSNRDLILVTTTSIASFQSSSSIVDFGVTQYIVVPKSYKALIEETDNVNVFNVTINN
jgi:hypothetical protein